MNHPLHPHQMRKKSEGEPFECSGCKELGLGRRYQCVENCDFVLHEDCFKARPTDPPKSHPFMGGRRFQFLHAPPGGQYRRFCDACGREVRGFLYHDIDKHKLHLHPCCMSLKDTMNDPFGRMVLKLKDKIPSKCVICKRKDIEVKSEEPFRGWSYVSSCGKYCYHVYCVKKLVYDNWERGHFNVASSSSTKSSSRGRSMSKDVSTAISSTSTIKSGKGTNMLLKNGMSSTARPSTITTRSGKGTSMSGTGRSSTSTTRSEKGTSMSSTVRSSSTTRSGEGTSMVSSARSSISATRSGKGTSMSSTVRSSSTTRSGEGTSMVSSARSSISATRSGKGTSMSSTARSSSTTRSGKGTSMTDTARSSSTTRSSKGTSMSDTARSSSTTRSGKGTGMPSTARSSTSTTRSGEGKTMVNTASSSASAVRRSEQGVRRSITPSATSSLSVATRKKPSTVTRVLIKIATVGFNAIISVLFGNPAPFIAALVKCLLDIYLQV